MNNLNEEIKTDTDGFAKAKKLREEAEALEAKERMKIRLFKLIEISKDPYYDQYLNQMLKDLESGKATPAQIGREADRTYRLYCQRMGLEKAQVSNDISPVSVPQKAKATAVEFKIGAGIFSTVGAVFVLASFVIFGFNFLTGIWQGLCLYAAALTVILLSELIVKRINRSFSIVITGIGIGSLFISTVINYLVLKTISGIVAVLITAVIALLSILLSWKKDAASIRLISFFGCYISFLPIKGFESELSFLIMAGMLLLINIVSVFLPNQKNKEIINAVHMAAHTIFTGVVTGVVLADGMDIRYPAFFVITSLVLLNLIYLREKEEKKIWSTIIFCLTIGFCAVYLVSIGGLSHGETNEKLMLFNKLMIEIMAIATGIVFFILWGKEKYRWIQYYFIAAIVVLFNGFTDYKLETVIGILGIFIFTKMLNHVKELTVLDGILTIITALQGLYMAKEWYIWIFALVMLLSVIRIKKMAVFHEIVITLFFIIGMLARFNGNWTLPGCAGVLLLLFLMFNHLPFLKDQKQVPYNIVNIIFAGFFYLCAWFCYDYIISSVTMLIGAAAIIISFRKRYGLAIPRKYLLLAGFLTFMILTAHYKTPVIVSILLMLVAVGCVGIGFGLKDKVYRIFGLIMAICVCMKLVIYDFRGLPSLSKVILFFAVGLIALCISFLYIYLEKREDREENENPAQRNTETENFGEEQSEKKTEDRKEGETEE